MKWELKKLGDICEIISGATPKRNNPVYWDGDIPWITPKDLSKLKDKYIDDAPEYITKKGLSSCSSKILPNGSILLSSRAPIGLLAITKIPLCTNQGFKSLIPSDKVYNVYLYYWLKYNKEFLNSLGRGATFKEVSKKIVEKIQIPLPPLPIQRQIAELLDTATALRQRTEDQLAELDRLAESVFLELFGDLVNNQKGWKYIEFGKVFKSLRYGTSSPPVYSSLGIPFIRATNIKKGGIAIKGLVYISELEAFKIEKCKLNEGDLIIVRSGANTGDCSRIPKEFHGAYGGFDIIVEIDEPHSRFYNFLINTKAGKALLEPLTRRAGQPHLNSKQITEFQVFDIPLSLQSHFAEIIENLEAQKAVLRRSLRESEDLVGCLLQGVFG